MNPLSVKLCRSSYDDEFLISLTCFWPNQMRVHRFPEHFSKANDGAGMFFRKCCLRSEMKDSLCLLIGFESNLSQDK